MPGTDAEGAGDLEGVLSALMEYRLPVGMPLPLQDAPAVYGAQQLTSEVLQEHNVRDII